MDRAQVTKAVHALLRHAELEQRGKADLLEASTMLYMVIGMATIPVKGSAKPRPISVPHPFFPSDGQVCLIVKEPAKETKAMLQEQGVTNVHKVIGLEKLRTAYKQFEARRNLVKQYDIFLADDRIVPMLTKTLGKTFLARKKNPVPIKIRRKDFGQAVQRVLDSTYLFLGSGPCSTVRVGPADLGVDGLVDNIVQGMENVVKHLPKGWASVKSVNLKTESSVALPVFTQLPTVGSFAPAAAPAVKDQPAARGQKRKAAAEPAEGDAEDSDTDDEARLAARARKRQRARRAAKGAAEAPAAAAPAAVAAGQSKKAKKAATVVPAVAPAAPAPAGKPEAAPAASARQPKRADGQAKPAKAAGTKTKPTKPASAKAKPAAAADKAKKKGKAGKKKPAGQSP